MRIKLLEFPSEFDSNDQLLATLYWEQDKDGKFPHKVKTLLNDFGVSSKRLGEVVGAAKVVASEYTCSECGDYSFYPHNREDLCGRHHYLHSDGRCDVCREAARIIQEEEQRKRQEAQRIEKIQACSEAVANGIYESLSDIEFNFLIALLNASNVGEAAKVIGVSVAYGSRLFDKLLQLDLLYMSDPEHYNFASGLHERLRGTQFRRRAKSVFGSPAAREVYRHLKRENAFVYPEIPLCVIVEKTAVAHLFTESWHSQYFLNCRIDFLICDEAGKPTSGIEYQGGYHENVEQRAKDQFKRACLEAVGVPLMQWSRKDLNQQTEH